MIEDEGPQIYPAADATKRRCVADMCLLGENPNREAIAADIRAGDLWRRDGRPKSYWHCLATVKPAPQPGRRGQWIVAPNDWRVADAVQWTWQDWGPEEYVPPGKATSDLLYKKQPCLRFPMD